MASNHLTTKPLSRAKGGSAVHAAAYIMRVCIEDERTGRLYDYSRKSDDVLFAGSFIPKGAPDWMRDTAQLWNGAERADTRINSRTARVLQIGLHSELTLEQNRWLLQDFIRENFTRKGIAAELAIHRPGEEGDERNIHAHILLTTRFTGSDGFAEKDRDSDRTDTLKSWRADWERRSNKTLERFGHETRISMGTLEAQGIDRIAETHLGRVAMALERKGIGTSRGDDLRETRAANQISVLERVRVPMAANDNQKAANDNEQELTRERQLQPTMKPEPDKGFVSASERLKLEEQQREREGKTASRERLSGSHGEIADAIYELNKTMRSQVGQTIANSQTSAAIREKEAPAPAPAKTVQAEKELQPKAPAPPIVEKSIDTAALDRQAEEKRAIENLRSLIPGGRLYSASEREINQLQKELAQLTAPEKGRADLAPEKSVVADPRTGFVQGLVTAIKELFTPTKTKEEAVNTRTVQPPANQNNNLKSQAVTNDNFQSRYFEQPPDHPRRNPQYTAEQEAEIDAVMLNIKQRQAKKQNEKPMPAQSRDKSAGRQVEASAAGLIGRKVEPAASVANRSVERRPEQKRETLLDKLQREARQNGDTLEVKLRPGPEKRLERILDVKRPPQPPGPRNPRN